MSAKRRPAEYHCPHCGNGGFTRQDGHPRGDGKLVCPTCRYGILVRSRAHRSS